MTDLSQPPARTTTKRYLVQVFELVAVEHNGRLEDREIPVFEQRVEGLDLRALIHQVNP